MVNDWVHSRAVVPVLGLAEIASVVGVVAAAVAVAVGGAVAVDAAPAGGRSVASIVACRAYTLVAFAVVEVENAVHSTAELDLAYHVDYRRTD